MIVRRGLRIKKLEKTKKHFSLIKLSFVERREEGVRFWMQRCEWPQKG
jgi:hypothetical protein